MKNITADIKERYQRWWDRDGTLLSPWSGYLPPGGSPGPDYPSQEDMVKQARDPEWRARCARYFVDQFEFPLDSLPMASSDIGPGSLALQLGARPEYVAGSFWFHPIYEEIEDVPPLKFDENNEWWLVTQNNIKAMVERIGGDGIVGCPDLVENWDILASLIDGQELLMAMISDPDIVKDRIAEIDQVWKETYQRIYQLICDKEGWAGFGAFHLFGKGKTAKIQCDGSAMFSPEMFNEFVLPSLTQQCEWLDNSMYHLDGTQAVCHLDSLLSIDALDAIEWTPQTGIECGGHERWFPMYKKILDAGKSLQIIGADLEQIEHIYSTFGTKGIFILYFDGKTAEDFSKAEKVLKKFDASY